MAQLKHDYEIKSYAPPNRGGGLLLHTWHDGEASRDMEIAVYRDRMRRGEVAHIEVISNVDPVGVTTIFAPASPQEPGAH